MVYIISELCGQWGGSIRRAEQMILQSKLAGADAVKVQLYDTYRMPGENRARWEYLNIDEDTFLRLRDFSWNLNLDFFASAFHEDMYQRLKIADLNINKVASIGLTGQFKELSDQMIKDKQFTRNYISLGQWKENDLPYSHEGDRNVYFHCVPEYPHSYDRAIELMPDNFSKDYIHGYSDHSIGVDACKEAIRRGAMYIEKHYTISQTLQSKTEAAHLCSMDMKQLEDLRNFCEVYQSA
tara:strand:+ start:2943 stop:3659 length:717 start_codon:yes stop_codon:yes gene_type:complete